MILETCMLFVESRKPLHFCQILNKPLITELENATANIKGVTHKEHLKLKI